MTHNDPIFDQDSFRGREDDGSETAATWIAAANTDWTQNVDANFRIRFLIQETNGGPNNNSQLQLQYNKNSGGWNDVNGTSSNAQSSLSTHFADDDNTTQQLGSGTFITPNSGMDEDNGLAGELNDIDFAGNDEVEVEYCLQLLSADVADGDTIQFRVLVDSTAISATNTPTVTVNEPTQFSSTREEVSAITETRVLNTTLPIAVLLHTFVQRVFDIRLNPLQEILAVTEELSHPITKSLGEVVAVFDEIVNNLDTAFFSQTIEEVSVITENITNNITKPVPEVFAVEDLSRFTTTLIKSEVLSIEDLFRQNITKQFSSTVSVEDLFRFSLHRSINEVSSITEEIDFGVSKSLSYTAAVLDELTTVSSLLQSITIEEIVDVLDATNSIKRQVFQIIVTEVTKITQPKKEERIF